MASEEENYCNACDEPIYYGYKVSCDGCDGTDSAIECSFHSKCIKTQNQCGICLKYFCFGWSDDCKYCKKCKCYICVHCVHDNGFIFTSNKPLCTKCKVSLYGNQKLDFIDNYNKCNQWNGARNHQYQSIYDAISKSPFCMNPKYKQMIGIIPQIIIHKITFYSISCCDILCCNYCNNQIISYQFEIDNKSNKYICDYYISDDETNDISFCSKCIEQRKMRYCQYTKCRKPDKNMAISSCSNCERMICSRHESELNCKNCGGSMNVCCEENYCNACNEQICNGCKACCDGCDGTDSSYECMLHSKCIKTQNQCGICLKYFCWEWGDCCKYCKKCQCYICTHCLHDIGFAFSTDQPLCNKCKK